MIPPVEDSLRDLLDGTLRTMGVAGQVRDAQIHRLFADAVGPALAPHCRADRIDRGALVIASDNSSLAHQLQLDSAHIIDSLNQALGSRVIRRFRFVPLDGSGK